MSRRIQCSNCGKRYLVEGEMTGKSIKCKVCGTVFTIPELPEDLAELLAEDEPPAAPAVKKKKKKKRG